MYRFIAGMIAGALASWYLADDLRRLGPRTRFVRTRAADALQAVEVRAEEILDSAKEQVSSTLHAGLDALRPRP